MALELLRRCLVSVSTTVVEFRRSETGLWWSECIEKGAVKFSPFFTALTAGTAIERPLSESFAAFDGTPGRRNLLPSYLSTYTHRPDLLTVPSFLMTVAVMACFMAGFLAVFHHSRITSAQFTRYAMKIVQGGAR